MSLINPYDSGDAGTSTSTTGDIPPVVTPTAPTTPTDNTGGTGSITGDDKTFSGTIDPITSAFMEQMQSILQSQTSQADAIFPILASQAGFSAVKGEDGKWAVTRMSEEQRLAQMDPVQRAQYDLQKMQLDKQKLAVEGKLPIPENVQQQLDEQRRVRESLLAQKLGPNWRASTPGQQSAALQDKSDAAILGAFNTGETQMGMQLLGQNQANMSNQALANQNALLGTQGMNQSAMQGYGNLTGMSGGWNQSNINSQRQADATSQAGLYQMLGTGAGAIASTAAIMM